MRICHLNIHLGFAHNQWVIKPKVNIKVKWDASDALHLPDVFEQHVRFSEDILKTGIFYNLIDRDIKPGQSFTTYGLFLEIFKRFTSLKSKVSRNLKVTNTNGFHLAGVSGGVVL